MNFASLLLTLSVLTSFDDVIVSSSTVTISNNGYSGLLIAINPEVPESSQLIDAIKEVWTNASKALYTATKQKAYFDQITILVPKFWNEGTYQTAGRETYDAADVLVAYPNPVYQDQPYTLQYGGCGEPGTYIHLTPSYLVNDSFVDIFGPKGKAMAHEWGHYRWGVFDETPTYGYDPFYYNSLGQIEATRCPVNLNGEFKVIDYSTGTVRNCQRNVQDGLPEDGCLFLPYEEQQSNLSTSIMSNQYIKQVELFCHNDENDPYNIHNKEAPNEQNRLCNLRSTWEVILNSSDFAEANLPNDPALDTTPTFRVVKPLFAQRYVLVLDTSSSMAGTRLDQMRQAVSIFIDLFVATGDRVALVQFATTAAKLTSLYTITNQDDRDYLLGKIPAAASGRTCIGGGIQIALQILQENGQDPAGGNIVVFSDGEENENPFVKDVADQVLQGGAVVNAIFFNTNANNDLETLVVDSRGIWFYGSDVNINNILGAFETLASSNDGDVYSEIFQVHSSIFDVDKYGTYIGYVDIDSTIGNSTVFAFAWDQYDIQVEVVLEHPSGCTYSTNYVITPYSCPDHPLYNVDLTYNVVSFPLPGTAETGRWRYYVSTAADRSQTVVASVTSQASDLSKQPIVVRSGLDKTDVGTGEAIVVYAQVSQGFAPVLDANVLALIQQPDGTVQEIELYDAGGAPDVRLDDGVYSRYFTGYSSPGSYGVQVTVSKLGNGTNATHAAGSRAPVNFGTINPDGSVNINPAVINYVSSADVSPSVETGNFSRVVTNKGFQYTGDPIDGTYDYYPPSKITDLIAEQIDVYDPDSGISLSFTAPGDDYDQGSALRYEIRYVINNVTQLVDSFETCTFVENGNVIEGNLTQPKAAGSKETFLISNDVAMSSGQITLGFALLAIDDHGQRGNPSNVAPVVYFYSSPGGAAPRAVAAVTSVSFIAALILYCVIV
ncbi:unnamed protein product [Clavelina lepadiformis]|uniref:VWFA domain-containing protein n=1 Tax=Clavelina lepadiformis TaxID=159417 RepID=A0ABP0FQU4_CLALP